MHRRVLGCGNNDIGPQRGFIHDDGVPSSADKEEPGRQGVRPRPAVFWPHHQVNYLAEKFGRKPVNVGGRRGGRGRQLIVAERRGSAGGERAMGVTITHASGSLISKEGFEAPKQTARKYPLRTVPAPRCGSIRQQMFGKCSIIKAFNPEGTRPLVKTP